MKPKYLTFALLCIILLLNVIFTQKMVLQYFFENYQNTIIYGALNLVLFPLAVLIYKRDVKLESGDKK